MVFSAAFVEGVTRNELLNNVDPTVAGGRERSTQAAVHLRCAGRSYAAEAVNDSSRPLGARREP